MLGTINTTGMQGFNKSERCPRDTRMTQSSFPVLYTVVFSAGISSNTVALWVFVHIPSNSTFIVYLKNTSVADLIMALMSPFKILSDSHLAPWQLRGFVCTLSSVVFYETMYVGIMMSGLIAFDRFLKIIMPFRKTFVKKTAFAKTVSISVWSSMFFISSPNMILNKEATPSSVKKCASLKSPLGSWWHQVVSHTCQFIFWAVFISMLSFYAVITKKVYNSYRKFRSKDSRHKRSEVKVFIVMAVFFVCFAPSHFVRIPYTYSQTTNKTDCRLENQSFIAKEATLFSATTNICMDPLIYIILCKKFTQKVPCVRWGKARTAGSSEDHHSSQTDNITLA